MNIDEKLEREYIFEYNTNKNMLSKEQKITIYNVLELEKEQKLNEIIKVENSEIGFMSMATGIIVVIIYITTLLNDVNDTLGIPDRAVGSYFLFAMLSILVYLIWTQNGMNKMRKERNTVEDKNKKINEEIIKISTKQAVIKRLLLEEDKMKV